MEYRKYLQKELKKIKIKNTSRRGVFYYAWLQLRNTLAERGLRPQAHDKYNIKVQLMQDTNIVDILFKLLKS